MKKEALKRIFDFLEEKGEHNAPLRWKILNNIPEPMKEFLLYITEQLKSGIHPSDLEDNEKKFLKDAFGNEWYIKYGYVEEDLYSIKTLEQK